MKLRDQYDWIVLGDHPGALLSAALVARLGLSVLVLPVFPAMPVSSTQKDNRFVDPESNFVLGLGRESKFNGLLSDSLSRLGILPAELELIDLKHPFPQILTSETRLNLQTDNESLQHEWRRELGRNAADASGLLSALKSAEAEYLSYWLALPDRLTLGADRKRTHASAVSLKEIRKKIAKSVGNSSESRWLSERATASDLSRSLARMDVKQLLCGIWYGSTSSVSSDPSLGSLLHLIAVSRTGASFRGGMSAYREFLLKLAKRLGAHIPPKAECRRIFVDQGRFTGVQIAHHGNVIAGNGAVIGCALSQVSGLVNMGGRNWFKKLRTSPSPAGWRFTLAFTVAIEGLPPGTSSHMVWKEAEAPELEMEIVNPEDYGVKKPDRRVVFVRALLPYNEESLTPGYQRMISARMLRQLTEIIPFVDSHLIEVYPEFRQSELRDRRDQEGELQEVYPFKKLEDIPENLRCLSVKSSSANGVGARSGIEGLFVATSESFPELGSLGGTVAALESVSWLAHRAGLAGPFA